MKRWVRITLAVGALLCLILLPVIFVVVSIRPDKPEFRPFTNGFGYVGYKGGIDMAPSADLCYQGPDGKVITLCWLEHGPFIKDDMAVLIGVEKRPGGGQPTLMAVKAPGPAFDITKDVARLGIARDAKDADRLVEQSGIVDLVQRGKDADQLMENDRLPPLPKTGYDLVAVILVNRPENPAIVVMLSWDQISQIINSKLHK